MAAHQAPLSLGFSRQEHWSGLPCPVPMHKSEKWKWSGSVVPRLLVTPWTAAYQAPPTTGFSMSTGAGCHCPLGRVQEGSLFSKPSPAFVVFDDGHSDLCEMVPHCNFDLHFSNSEWYWASFHVFISHLYVFFGEMSVYVFCPLFDCVVCFSGVELRELLVCFVV